MSNLSSLKNILFDLGGVILDLNVGATLEAFLDLGFPKELLSYPENYYTDIFFSYETGKSNTKEFRDAIRKAAAVDFSDQDFDKAWCAMLAKVPATRPRILKSLSEKYDLYVLSNTSSLHIEKFTEMFEKVAEFPLEKVFKKTYYSHEIGLHKPAPEAFEYVLEHAGIKAEETLFLDDNIQNVKAAKELGFNVIHISDSLKMENVGFDS